VVAQLIEGLEARARLRDGAPGVVVCHPHPAFGGRLDTPLVVALADGLAEAGFSTVRFNFRGLGGSRGEPTGGVAEHEDVRIVADWLRARGAPRVALAGYSFGALMALKAVARGASAAALAAIGLPSVIVGNHAERIADVERAFASGVPALFLHGDRDPFCEAARVAAWAAGRPSVTLDVLSGQGHFFAGDAERDVVARVAAFLTTALR
jgi:alpha/beta superfamily hydrolase